MARKQISRRGIALLQTREGFRARRYIDVGGHATIGYGHKIRGHEEILEPMTQAEGIKLMLSDIAPIEIYLNAVLPKLNQDEFDALVSLIFNIGLGAFERSDLLVLLRRGDMAKAADEFLIWVYVNKVVIAGQVARRAEERLQFLGQLPEGVR